MTPYDAYLRWAQHHYDLKLIHPFHYLMANSPLEWVPPASSLFSNAPLY